MQREQKLARRAVGAMNSETPGQPVGLGADLAAVAPHAALIVGAPGLRAAGGDAAAAFRLDEFDAARIRKSLFGRIDDLHDMAARAAAGELRQRAPDLVEVAPQVGQDHDLGERGGREARRQARALGAVVHDRLRHALDHVAAAGRAHQSGNADALAAFDQNLGKRQRDHQRAVQLVVVRKLRRE